MNRRGVLAIRKRPGVGGMIPHCPLSLPDVFCFTEATSNDGSGDWARAADIASAITKPVSSSRHRMGLVSTVIDGQRGVTQDGGAGVGTGLRPAVISQWLNQEFPGAPVNSSGSR